MSTQTVKPTAPVRRLLASIARRIAWQSTAPTVKAALAAGLIVYRDNGMADPTTGYYLTAAGRASLTDGK